MKSGTRRYNTSTAGGVSLNQRVSVIAMMHQYSYTMKKTQLSQTVEWFRNTVNGESSWTFECQNYHTSLNLHILMMRGIDYLV